jgi:tRNA (mo5U34)-methyltransferase
MQNRLEKMALSGISTLYRGMKLPLDEGAVELAIRSEIARRVNPETLQLLEAFDQLPDVTPTTLNMAADRIGIGTGGDLSDLKERHQLETALKALKPWRKGPFDFFGLPLDAEWASELKWKRLLNHLPNVKNKRILDVGCNSGYFLFKLLAHKPKLCFGIDPVLLYFIQFQAIQKYVQSKNIYFAPIGWDELGPFTEQFDLVLCMGILYHHPAPPIILKQLKRMMRKKGLIIFETLIIPGDDSVSLTPKNRYARMSNIYFIPTLNCLKNWLIKANYKSIEVIDVTPTTPKEQRVTPWSYNQSLSDFLDPTDPTKTVEGYPAPLRVIIKASKSEIKE